MIKLCLWPQEAEVIRVSYDASTPHYSYGECVWLGGVANVVATYNEGALFVALSYETRANKLCYLN